jgi:hypothetical protein
LSSSAAQQRRAIGALLLVLLRAWESLQHSCVIKAAGVQAHAEGRCAAADRVQAALTVQQLQLLLVRAWSGVHRRFQLRWFGNCSAAGVIGRWCCLFQLHALTRSVTPLGLTPPLQALHEALHEPQAGVVVAACRRRECEWVSK